MDIKNFSALLDDAHQGRVWLRDDKLRNVIKTNWRDKAAPAGYFSRWASPKEAVS